MDTCIHKVVSQDHKATLYSTCIPLLCFWEFSFHQDQSQRYAYRNDIEIIIILAWECGKSKQDVDTSQS